LNGLDLRSGSRSRTIPTATACWRITGRASGGTVTCGRWTLENSSQLTLSWGAGPARGTPWLDSVVAWLTHAADSSPRSSESLVLSLPVGFSWRTFLACVRFTKAGTWASSSGRWENSGFGGPTAAWTLNTSTFPSDGSACSLSAILETQAVPSRYFLSPRAARGILRRAERRGKELPTPLRQALEALATATETPGTATTSRPTPLAGGLARTTSSPTRSAPRVPTPRRMALDEGCR